MLQRAKTVEAQRCSGIGMVGAQHADITFLIQRAAVQVARRGAGGQQREVDFPLLKLCGQPLRFNGKSPVREYSARTFSAAINGTTTAFSA